MLTVKQIESLKAKDKDYSVFDNIGNGLFLKVTSAGGKLWRMNYRFNGKMKSASFGKYPAVSLSDARKRADEFKSILASGVDPMADAKAKKALQIQTNLDNATPYLRDSAGNLCRGGLIFLTIAL